MHVSWTGLRSIETQELGGNVIQMQPSGDFNESYPHSAVIRVYDVRRLIETHERAGDSRESEARTTRA